MKNNLIDFIAKLGAALQPQRETEKTYSSPQEAKPITQKIENKKPPAMDAIVAMIRRHDELSKKIDEKIKEGEADNKD